MDQKDRQAEFLLAEYNQIHNALERSMTNIHHGFRLFVTIIAASIGALVVGFSKEVNPKVLFLLASILSSFLLIISIIGLLVFIHGHYGWINRMKALNSIRRYFLRLDPQNQQFFTLPVTSDVMSLNRLSNRSAFYFSGFFVVAFSVLTSVLWLLYAISSTPLAVSFGFLAGVVAVIFQVVYIRQIQSMAEQMEEARKSICHNGISPHNE